MASAHPIHFGTSGWRGIIAETFTFANVRLAAAGIAQYLLTRNKRPRVVVGYDTRFLSEKFAAAAAAILNSHGVQTDVAARPDPTPALAYHILHHGLDGGVNITASHNPAEYNGLKFSGADGAPALPEVTTAIEDFIDRVARGEYPLTGPCSAGPLQHSTDPRPAYLDAIRSKVDLKLIARAGLKVACDPLFGTARGYLDELLREAGCDLRVLHDYRDVLFSGAGSEPSEKNLGALSALVREQHCAVGLATDGDADRFGIVDADGSFISANYVLALLADYLLGARKLRGGLARSVATTHLIDAVARHHGVPVYETPVGFKYIGELIKADKIALGGEESSGMSIGGHLPEKDGILACLLVAEAVGCRGLSVKQQLEELFRRVGAFYSVRINLSLAADAKARLQAKLARDRDRLGAHHIARIDRTDGLKLVCEDGCWVLMRLSGTEPVVRIYGEAGSPQELEGLMAAAKAFVLQ